MNIKDFFTECRVENNCVFFPDIQLPQSKYSKEVRQPLLDLGGIWDSNMQCFKFPFDPTGRIRELADGRKTKLSSKFHFFETPTWLGHNLFLLCQEGGIAYYNILDVPNAKCLEPSAGRGALITRLFIEGFKNVSYYENMPENREILSNYNYYGNTPEYKGDDFMQCKDYDYDLIIANPPFRYEEKHIKHMIQCVRPGGIILTIASPKIYSSTPFEGFLNSAAEKWIMRKLDSDKDDPIFKGTHIGCTILALQKKENASVHQSELPF